MCDELHDSARNFVWPHRNGKLTIDLHLGIVCSSALKFVIHHVSTASGLAQEIVIHQFTESLMTALDAANSEDAVFAALLSAAHSLGFEHLAYGLRLAVPVSNPKVITLNNYPQSWQMRYQEAGYMGVDPSVRHGVLSRLPLVWTDEVFSSARELWEEARHAGLRVGWAQSSLDGSGVGGMLTLSRSSESLSETELVGKQMEMRWLVQAAHLSLSRVMQPKFTVQPDVPLTPREIEVLKWSADGKTASEIGDILSIAVPTVNFHIKNVVLKMKAANKTAAVVRALMSGLLN